MTVDGGAGERHKVRALPLLTHASSSPKEKAIEASGRGESVHQDPVARRLIARSSLWPAEGQVRDSPAVGPLGRNCRRTLLTAARVTPLS